MFTKFSKILIYFLPMMKTKISLVYTNNLFIEEKSISSVVVWPYRVFLEYLNENGTKY